MLDVAPTGTEFLYNTDVNPGEEYLASFPRLRMALRYQPLVRLFEGFDELANTYQRSLRRTGLTSLWLGAFALWGITAKLLVAALGGEVPASLIAVFEFSAVGSIALALGPWFRKTRAKWLTARFITERIRQWNFQLLLDGALICSATRDPVAFEAARKGRWAQFEAQTTNAEGMWTSFADGGPLDFYHDVASYGDPSTADEVVRAYNHLRFEHQFSYFKLKREKLAAIDESTEYLARATIFAAIVLAAGQLLIILLNWIGYSVSNDAGAWIAAAAIGLVILNASIRVYQNARRLSEQRERFDTKWLGLMTLKARFDGAATMNQRLGVMHEVEALEAEELREFLRQMRRASYLL